VKDGDLTKSILVAAPGAPKIFSSTWLLAIRSKL